MSDSFSPTGYWAHYLSQWTDEHGVRLSFGESLPVASVADGRALVITEDGDVVSAARFQQILKDYIAGEADPSVRLTVTPFPPDSE